MKTIGISNFYIITLIILSLFILGCTSAPDNTAGNPKSSDVVIPANTQETTHINTTNTESVVSSIVHPGYYGKILAGNKTPYIEFDNRDYERAAADGKVILLYFYTDLNSICIAEESKIFKAFDDMSNSNMIGFKVHYEDSKTTDAEKQLATALKVESSHTKIILKNGTVMQRRSDTWDINTYASQMSLYLDK